MIDTTVRAYATRQLACLVLAGVLVTGLLFVRGVSARTGPPEVSPEPAGSVGTRVEGWTARQPIEGLAHVVDGDTIIVNGVRIRLEGIDAPETAQTCQLGSGEAWPCGHRATAMLARIIAGRPVACEDRGRDKYGRTLGVCRTGDVEINAEMVRRGYAWAFVRYSQAYVGLEAEARRVRAGVWRGDAIAPWDYRAGRWASAEPVAPKGCAIKGNVTARGRIYHLPWSPWYEKVRMDGDRGKRWFCTEAEAIAAGWRPAQL